MSIGAPRSQRINAGSSGSSCTSSRSARAWAFSVASARRGGEDGQGTAAASASRRRRRPTRVAPNGDRHGGPAHRAWRTRRRGQTRAERVASSPHSSGEVLSVLSVPSPRCVQNPRLARGTARGERIDRSNRFSGPARAALTKPPPRLGFLRYLGRGTDKTDKTLSEPGAEAVERVHVGHPSFGLM